MPVMDPALVAAELEKPIALDGEMRRYYGLAPRGDEKTVNYSLRDKWRVARETERIYKELTKGKPKNAKVKRFTITAGGPGAGKTTLVRKLQEKGGPLESAVHLDADELLKVFRPYARLVESLGETDAARAIAYTYWRSASLYMMNTFMNRLVDDGYDVVLGVTGTSPSVRFLYDGVKKAGYESDLIMCHAPEDVRLSGVAKRFEQERRYTPDADVKEKGNRMFPEVVKLHMSKAGNLKLYWRGEDDKVTLAAETEGGRVVTRDKQALDAFTGEIRARKPDFDWNDAVGAYESRFAPPQKAPAAASPSR